MRRIVSELDGYVLQLNFDETDSRATVIPSSPTLLLDRLVDDATDAHMTATHRSDAV